MDLADDSLSKEMLLYKRPAFLLFSTKQGAVTMPSLYHCEALDINVFIFRNPESEG